MDYNFYYPDPICTSVIKQHPYAHINKHSSSSTKTTFKGGLDTVVSRYFKLKYDEIPLGREPEWPDIQSLIDMKERSI